MTKLPFFIKIEKLLYIFSVLKIILIKYLRLCLFTTFNIKVLAKHKVFHGFYFYTSQSYRPLFFGLLTWPSLHLWLGGFGPHVLCM